MLRSNVSKSLIEVLRLPTPATKGVGKGATRSRSWALATPIRRGPPAVVGATACSHAQPYPPAGPKETPRTPANEGRGGGYVGRSSRTTDHHQWVVSNPI
jgi:hypothetical protein